MLENYFKNGKLIIFPKKQKAKQIICQYIMQFFKEDEIYDEKTVNNKIANIYEDYAIIRRYLIDENYLQRSDDGSEYRKTVQ